MYWEALRAVSNDEPANKDVIRNVLVECLTSMTGKVWYECAGDEFKSDKVVFLDARYQLKVLFLVKLQDIFF